MKHLLLLLLLLFSVTHPLFGNIHNWYFDYIEGDTKAEGIIEFGDSPKVKVTGVEKSRYVNEGTQMVCYATQVFSNAPDRPMTATMTWKKVDGEFMGYYQDDIGGKGTAKLTIIDDLSAKIEFIKDGYIFVSGKVHLRSGNMHLKYRYLSPEGNEIGSSIWIIQRSNKTSEATSLNASDEPKPQSDEAASL